MTEEETQSVEETHEATAQAPESAEHNDVSEEAYAAEQRKRNDAEYNWAEMRRQMREKDQQIADLRHQFSQISQRQPTQDEEDELAKLAEDDILTVAQAKKLAQMMARNVAMDVIKQREATTVDERIGMKYSDYADVVTKENIELAEQQEPELAKAIGRMDDPYEQRVAAYKLLKRVAGQRPKADSIEKKKAMENSQKPLSVNAVTKNSAIGNAHLFENGLTKELKAQLWKEMQDSARAG